MVFFLGLPRMPDSACFRNVVRAKVKPPVGSHDLCFCVDDETACLSTVVRVQLLQWAVMTQISAWIKARITRTLAKPQGGLSPPPAEWHKRHPLRLEMFSR